jgi:hypothetical protein
MVVETAHNPRRAKLGEALSKLNRLLVSKLVLVFLPRPRKGLVTIDGVLWLILTFGKKTKDIERAKCGSTKCSTPLIQGLDGVLISASGISSACVPAK